MGRPRAKILKSMFMVIGKEEFVLLLTDDHIVFVEEPTTQEAKLYSTKESLTYNKFVTYNFSEDKIYMGALNGGVTSDTSWNNTKEEIKNKLFTLGESPREPWLIFLLY